MPLRPAITAECDSDSTEHLLRHDERIDTEEDNEKMLWDGLAAHASQRKLIWCMTALNLILFAISTSLAIRGHWLSSDPNRCIKATSSYSPIHNDIIVELEDVKLNGTLFPGPQPSWSRLPPGTPLSEDTWQSFETMHTFPLTAEDVRALGKDTNTVARYPSMFGYGDGAYIGTLDVQHKLHCLNEVRKMAFMDYGENQSPRKKQHGKLWWVHLRHCLDMLAQDMMCHADADIVTYQWVDTQPIPFPDFSLYRKCRNFNALIEWRDTHRADPDVYMRIEKPTSGIHQVPMDPEYYALFGFDGSDLYPDGRGYGPLPNIDEFFGLPPTQ